MMEASFPSPAGTTMADSLHGTPGAYRFCFAEYEFDSRSLELCRMGESVTLQPRPARVLAVLMQAGGELVTPEELRRQVWGEHLSIDFGQSLKTCIKQIRSALGDDARAPRFVETLPRRGYRFIAPVQGARARAGSDPNAESKTLLSGAPAHFSPRELALAGIIVVLVLALVMLALLSG